jgi:hypothetical protein
MVKIRAECSVYRDIRNARSQSARVEFGAEWKQVVFVVVAFRLLIVIVFAILMYGDWVFEEELMIVLVSGCCRNCGLGNCQPYLR